MKMEEEKNIAEVIADEKDVELSAEDRERFENIANDLLDLEEALEKHGSSVKSLLASVARHTLGVTI
jgi:hypothetical protein